MGIYRKWTRKHRISSVYAENIWQWREGDSLQSYYPVWPFGSLSGKVEGPGATVLSLGLCSKSGQSTCIKHITIQNIYQLFWFLLTYLQEVSSLANYKHDRPIINIKQCNYVQMFFKWILLIYSFKKTRWAWLEAAWVQMHMCML